VVDIDAVVTDTERVQAVASSRDHLAARRHAYQLRHAGEPSRRRLFSPSWSTRRAHINTRRSELAIQFQDDHGRPPTPVEALHLAQQATLETRDAKHEPRSLAEQRASWLSEAAAELGGRGAVASMVRAALAPPA
jgi:TrwC relaxase